MAMVQCKQYKAFKRDIKPNGTMTGDSLTAYEFLRANLEYVKVSQISATPLYCFIFEEGQTYSAKVLTLP